MAPAGPDGRGDRGPHQLPDRWGTGYPQRLYRVRHTHAGRQPRGPAESVPKHHGRLRKRGTRYVLLSWN